MTNFEKAKEYAKSQFPLCNEEFHCYIAGKMLASGYKWVEKIVNES